MKSSADHGTRPYRMGARQEAVDATRDEICRSTMQLWFELPYDEMTLNAIAERAGVTRQTVLRHFGSKEELILAAAAWMQPQLDDGRRVDVSDREGALDALVDQYEFMGDANIRMLQVEDRFETVQTLLRDARAYHRAWIEEVFSPQLDGLAGGDRRRTIDALYAATDVGTWKLLRRDLGRSRDEVRATIGRLVAGVLHGLDR